VINFAWFICFAPIENPQVAIAVVMEGDTPGEETAGGRYAVPVAAAILRKWDEQKKARPLGVLPSFISSRPAPLNGPKSAQ
jgi:penicillin-binding protein 2